MALAINMRANTEPHGDMKFTFKDFKGQWTDFTVTEIYIAKRLCLVKYVLAGGITWERKPKN